MGHAGLPAGDFLSRQEGISGDVGWCHSNARHQDLYIPGSEWLCGEQCPGEQDVLCGTSVCWWELVPAETSKFPPRSYCT